jgi:hypothetical protein
MFFLRPQVALEMDRGTYNNKERSELSDWFEMGTLFHDAFPHFGPIWNDLCKRACLGREDHVLGMLHRHFKSIKVVGEHVFYSYNCVHRYSRTEASNTYESYVQFHFYNFIARVKTSLDMHALMINHIYQFHLEGRDCSLEKGPLTGCLQSDVGNRRLASCLDRERNDWIKAFVQMRNLLLHRTVIDFVIGSAGRGSLVQVPVGTMLRVPKERETLERFLNGIDIPVPSSCMLDPLAICDALCQKWKALSISILELSEDKVRELIQQNT